MTRHRFVDDDNGIPALILRLRELPSRPQWDAERAEVVRRHRGDERDARRVALPLDLGALPVDPAQRSEIDRSSRRDARQGLDSAGQLVQAPAPGARGFGTAPAQRTPTPA